MGALRLEGLRVVRRRLTGATGRRSHRGWTAWQRRTARTERAINAWRVRSHCTRSLYGTATLSLEGLRVVR